MPLAPGALLRHRGSHLQHRGITGILRQTDGVDILLRERQPNLLLDRANRSSPMPPPDIPLASSMFFTTRN